MADAIRYVSPRKVAANDENPRLIFHADELQSLQDSIQEQGILVPLTVFAGSKSGTYVLLDGERRWRCATKLGLEDVPVIVQPRPDRLTNIMMMFAIHNTRKDWDPLPTAYKLRELEEEFERRRGRRPNEAELAGLASVSRGEVRRLKKLLGLPEEYRKELMDELAKPRSEQAITVDHVLEATKGAAALRQRAIITSAQEDKLRRAIMDKFRTKVIRNTVAPRQLARIARAVDRGEVAHSTAKAVARRLISDPNYSIDDAFAQSVEQVDFEHTTEQVAERLAARLKEHQARGYELGEGLRSSLATLGQTIRQLLR